jgi:exodeoxyribonuclease V alpha subunit
MDQPVPLPESLSGLIERVTFFNEENGYAVLRVKVKGERELVTVVGVLASVSAGEWIHAQGRWVRDREYGRQFRAEVLTSTAPTTREGIEKYLGSGMVKGIGPVYARKLVDHFGERIFDVIEQTSGRLEEVPGVGPQRRRRIKEAWAEQKVVRAIMVFLHSHGVSTSRAVRIYKTYGEEAVERVRANPYLLARDIRGIGFKSADQIAQRLGVPADSLLRASAGLQHVLVEAMNEGHCALPGEELQRAAVALLGVDAGLVDTALERSVEQAELTRERVGEAELVYLPHVQRAEREVSERIRRLAIAPSLYPAIDLERAIAWCEQRTSKVLAPSQRAALAQALSSRLLVLTGGPGVGKTTLVDAILRILRAKQVRCLLCAPTGRAAKRLGEATGLEAKTIHRLLEVDPRTGAFTRNERRPLDTDLVVVDEVSMVDVLLMQQVLRALPLDGSLMLVGDADQLPSVGPGVVLRDLMASGRVPVVRLTEVFRQAADSRIITTAHAVREGRFPSTTAAGESSDFYFVEREEPEAILRTVLGLVKERIPQRFGLDAIGGVQVLSPMNRGLLGIQELNVRLQSELNPPRPGEPTVEKYGWQFRPGDKVMQLENNYEKEVYNGDIGRITRIEPEERQLRICYDGREVEYDFGELDEISLAYAITIHKSQGSEFPAVVMALASQHYLLLQRNLVYTGLTRGRKLVVVVGQRRALAMAVRNHETQRRYSGLLARLQRDFDPLVKGT